VLAAQNLAGGSGAVVLTSRVSVEMVQKTAMIGTSILVAVSAPTALAVRTADACGMTLVSVARGLEFEIICHPDGVRPSEAAPCPLERSLSSSALPATHAPSSLRLR
jgi:FdhD protein